MIIPKQCKAARALLEWKQSDLADKSGVSVGTIKNFEAGRKQANFSTVQALEIALEKAGVEFTSGSGLRLKKG